MTAWPTERLPVSAEDRRIAALAAAAIGLSLAEAALPSPLPGVKPGLANIVVLIVLLRYGLAAAVWVGLLRVFAAAILLGGLFSPGFFLSLAGALASLAMLAVTRHLPRAWFGPVSLSLLAALAHLAGQLVLVRALLIPHAGVWALLPPLALAALVFGTVNGLVAARLLDPSPQAQTA
jgi:heptaprenyl diphosphate synthase